MFYGGVALLPRLIFSETEIAASGHQLLGFSTVMLGWVGLKVSIAIPQWQMSLYTGNIIIAQARGRAPNRVCLSYRQPTGCSSPDGRIPGVGLPGYVCYMMGMKYTLSGGGDKVKKAHLVETGGTFFMVVGLAALVAFSWIGHGVVPDFYNPLIPMNVKGEFGPAIYIGCAGSSLVILGGLLLLCS